MTTYEFTVFLDRSLADDDYETLFETGLDDTTPGSRDGRGVLDVARVAPSLGDAIASVAADADRAGFTVVGIEENDLVSLKSVAERTGRTYESVRLLALGKRGPGNFPAPLSGDGWALYSWADVADWFAETYGFTGVATDDDRTLAAAGLILRARALAGDELLSALIALGQRPADRSGE